MLQTVILLKRGDNQQQGTVTSYTIYECRQSLINKNPGETFQGDMTSDHRCIWHIPRVEMQRIGVHYFNPLDRIIDSISHENRLRYWQPEGTTNIDITLFEVHVDLWCLRVDPPVSS